jgi:cytochrome P450
MTVDPPATEPRMGSRDPASGRARAASPMVKCLTLWLIAHPGVTRFLLRLAGRLSPVLVLGHHVVVTGHAEICAVLSRDADFVLNSDAPPVMLDGPFVLRMERGPQYLREIEVLRRVAGRQDLMRIRDIAKAEAERCIRGLGGGSIDVVEDLAVPVGMRLITDYLGASDPAPPPDLVLWLRRLAGFIVIGGFNNPADKQAADAAAAALRRYVESLMVARRRALAAGTAGDDVLTRLMIMAGRDEIDDDLMRRN